MFNTVIMVGNLTRDIDLRYMSNGTAIAKSAVATSHKYKSANGEQKDEVCFLDFNIFGRSAEIANQYLKKGSKVLLEGRLIFEQWTAQDGSTRSKHSLRVESMKMMDSKNQNGSSESTIEPTSSETETYQPKVVYDSKPGVQKIPDFDINEDEIPF